VRDLKEIIHVIFGLSDSVTRSDIVIGRGDL
jgi:hypothetical protein